MIWAALLSILVGFSTVLQGGLNRQIAIQWGVAGAVLLNSFFYITAAILLFLISKKLPQFVPEIFHDKGTLTQFSWWYLIPGLCGFLIVVGAPIVIAKIGAFKLVLGVVTAQLVFGLLWDVMVEDIPATTTRIAGAVLAFISVILVSMKR